MSAWQWIALVAAVALIVAGVIPIAMDMRTMRVPVGPRTSPLVELVWAALPIVFLALLVVLAIRAT